MYYAGKGAVPISDWPTICRRETDGRTVAFKVTAYLCGNKDCAVCNNIWKAVWETPVRAGSPNTIGTEAVAQGGDEPRYLVQAGLQKE